MNQSLKEFLDQKVIEYNQASFIKEDPVSIPHLFSRKQDIEIAGFFAAIFAWGNRATIINKSKELMAFMGMNPHDFCLNLDRAMLERMLKFRHRTFNDTDLLYFLEFFQQHYQKHDSLEQAFTSGIDSEKGSIEEGLINFHRYFFSMPDVPERTRKHIASPERGSTCKRLNMYLRWMVRSDEQGVDFGIWKTISAAQLICPIDVHVARVSRKLGLLERKQTDWEAAIELTERLKKLDANDPVKYDFALFGLGVIEKFG